MQYYVGYLEINELKNLYMEKHSEKNALRNFHEFILKFGPAPFDVIKNGCYKIIVDATSDKITIHIFLIVVYIFICFSFIDKK